MENKSSATDKAVARMGKRGGHGHFGAWRAVFAIPAVCGSVLILATAFGWLGAWANLVLAGWLLIGAALLWLPLERVAVRLAYGYRSPHASDWELLAPLHGHALQRCGLPATAIDLYVRPTGPGVNAYAAGRRSVAVSSELITAFRDGRLSEQQAVAVLTHEVAHHLDRATRYGLVIGWLTAPWCAVAAVFGGLLRVIVARVPTAHAALLLVPLVATVAVVQLVSHHAWLSLSVLIGLALVAWVHPLADVAICRASERAADEHTVSLGTGTDLAAALENFSTGDVGSGWRASHPSLACRLEHLMASSTPR